MENKIELVIIANNKTKCRGLNNNVHNLNRSDIIPKGSKALRICTYSAGGWSTAFFCKSCMKILIENMKQVVNELKV